MSQLSFFSADLTPPRVEDLGGLLAAHGQISRSGSGARLSILLADEWRARALLREFRVRDVEAQIVSVADALSAGLMDAEWVDGDSGHPDPRSTEPDTESDAEQPDAGQAGRGSAGPPTTGVLLRSERTKELDEVARNWNRGAVKAVPPGLVAGAGLLRCWTLAAGRADEGAYLLGLDRHAPDTFESLASACARAGLAGALIGARGGGPGLRIVGHRRHTRLVELLGTPPPEAPPGAFPLPDH